MNSQCLRKARFLAWLGVTVLILSGCRSVPMTGRKQLVMYPEAQEIDMGVTAFQEVTSAEPPSANSRYNEMVSRVGQRIAAVAGRPDYQWEFRVIASAEQNAFCLPGGKVVVYEGILPICENEAGLAVVMSHEIAHALARHGGERMTQNFGVNQASKAVSLVTRTWEQKNKELAMQAYGLGSKYGVILPYSRKHESEADHMGLLMMAKAGYDPSEAPRFWQRFGAVKNGAGPPEFMSTHPSDDRRASQLTKLLPEAMQIYEAAAAKFGTGDVIAAAAPAGAPGAGVPRASGSGPPTGSAGFAGAGPSWPQQYGPNGPPQGRAPQYSQVQYPGPQHAGPQHAGPARTAASTGQASAAGGERVFSPFYEPPPDTAESESSDPSGPPRFGFPWNRSRR